MSWTTVVQIAFLIMVTGLVVGGVTEGIIKAAKK